MKDPYEVLNISRNATEEEIKSVYRELSKKYHPDRYSNNPLRDLAEEKMREINEAYDSLMKNMRNGQNHQELLHSVRRNIKNGNLDEAERILNIVNMKNGEWYFLMGILNQKKGWFDAAYDCLGKAVAMEPGNGEYSHAFNSMNMKNDNFRDPYNKNSNNNLCDICATLYCLDCLCECMGGDFISCC